MSKQASLVKRNIPAIAYRKEKSRSQSLLSSLLISIGAYFVSLILICLAFCVYLAGKENPLSSIFIMSMTSSAISSFLGAFFLCKRWRQNSFACALTFIGITLAISLIMTLISKNTLEFSKALLSKLPSVISAFLGSFVGKIKKTTSPYDKYSR